MKKVLVVSGHTDLNNSVANKTILERLEKQLPKAEFVYLDKLYSDFQIDIENEQKRRYFIEFFRTISNFKRKCTKTLYYFF